MAPNEDSACRTEATREGLGPEGLREGSLTLADGVTLVLCKVLVEEHGRETRVPGTMLELATWVLQGSGSPVLLLLS